MTDVTTLHVRGSAEAEFPPDYAVVSVRISDLKRTSEAAFAACEPRVTEVRTRAEAIAGVRRVVLSRVHVAEEFEWRNDPPPGRQVSTGWRATVSGSLELDTAAVDDTLAELSAAGVEIGGVWWQLDRDHPGFRQVRTEAVADAFRAAEDFAVALGRDLGELTVLADSGLLAAGGGGGGEQPVARMALKMEGAAPGGAALPATDPAPQRLAAQVEATFALK